MGYGYGKLLMIMIKAIVRITVWVNVLARVKFVVG